MKHYLYQLSNHLGLFGFKIYLLTVRWISRFLQLLLILQTLLIALICGYLRKHCALNDDGDAKDKMQAYWLQLPNEVMNLIIQRLDLGDRVRMLSVCKSWKFLTMQKDIPVPPQLPWLMIFKHSRSKQFGFLWPFGCPNTNVKLSFYDLSLSKMHNFTLPKSVQGGRCFGTSKGWLWIAKGSQHNPQIFLLNPLSTKIMQLPSITTVPKYFKYVAKLKYPCSFTYFFSRIDLSFGEIEDEIYPSCTILAILANGRVLATCKPGDYKWTTLSQVHEQDNHGFLDISFYKGMLYVLCTKTSPDTSINVSNIPLDLSNSVIPINLIPDLIIANLDVEQVQEEKGYTILKNAIRDSALVESRGELLILHKYYDLLCSEEDEGVFEYHQVKKFELYNIDHSGASLNNDQVLFVGKKGSPLSLSAKNFNGFQGNCIHFVDDVTPDDICDFDPIVVRESGIFCFEDGRIIRCYPSLNYPSTVFWFTPLMNFTCIS